MTSIFPMTTVWRDALCLSGRQRSAHAIYAASARSVVAESGFGTVLNFLTLWQAFDPFQRAQPDATLQRLHFISFEKFPMTQADLIAAH